MDQIDANCQTTILIDSPSACSNTCEIMAGTSDINCDDNNSPADSTDDTFTFGLTVSGQNLSTGWQTEDGSFSGTFNSLYTIGPYPITEETRTLTVMDQMDANCKTTIRIDPPAACSNTCEIFARTSDIICDDNNTPADSTDDAFTFGLTIYGQNLSTGWQTEDGSFSGTFDSLYTIGPYPISEGTKTLTIMDQLDDNCQTTIFIDPPDACSQKCLIDVILWDSCVIDSAGQRQIYYFIEVNIPEPDPQFWIYHQNKLLDIIPGNGNIPIGPFSAGNIGEELIISYDKNPNCLEQVRLNDPTDCKEMDPPPCNLEIKDLSFSKCVTNVWSSTAEVNMSLRVLSTAYPVDLLVKGKWIANIVDDGKHEYFIPSIEKPDNPDSIDITISQSTLCQKTIQFSIPCPNNTEYFPNAFSPNQDGQNDQWIAQLPTECKLVSAAIYDRWGNRVFMRTNSGTADKRILWDGIIGSQQAEPGLYLYKIAWKEAGKTKFSSGEILLIR